MTRNMKQSPAASLMLFAALIAGEARAFWGKGHLLVARIAEQILTEKDPNALQKALDELNLLPKSHPDMIEHERDHPFTECATFADDIKPTFGDWQSPWHFVDQPYLDEPGTTLDDFDFVPSDTDIVSALTDLTNFLKSDKDEENERAPQNTLRRSQSSFQTSRTKSHSLSA